MTGSLAVAVAALVAAAPQPTTSQLVGQHLMGSFRGTRPSAEVLRRVERGELGGILVRSVNVRSVATLEATIAELQAAARRGGQPRS